MKESRLLLLLFALVLASFLLSRFLLYVVIDSSLCPFLEHPVACTVWVPKEIHWKARWINAAILIPTLLVTFLVLRSRRSN